VSTCISLCFFHSASCFSFSSQTLCLSQELSPLLILLSNISHPISLSHSLSLSLSQPLALSLSAALSLSLSRSLSVTHSRLPQPVSPSLSHSQSPSHDFFIYVSGNIYGNGADQKL
ncbi:unnamed protein product, partial [Prunus brigantina]